MIFIVQKSSFLGDLRSFLLLFFVWTENKGAFTVTKKLQRLYTCCSVSNKLSQVSQWFSKANQLIFLPSHLPASIVFCLFVQQVEFCATVLFLGDFTPDCIVLNSLSETGNFAWPRPATATNLLHEEKLFTNYSSTDTCHFVSFPACVKAPSLRKLLTGSCFVLRVATSPRDKNKAAAQTPSHLR